MVDVRVTNNGEFVLNNETVISTTADGDIQVKYPKWTYIVSSQSQSFPKVLEEELLKLEGPSEIGESGKHWVTKEGAKILIEELDDVHLFNIVVQQCRDMGDISQVPQIEAELIRRHGHIQFPEGIAARHVCRSGINRFLETGTYFVIDGEKITRVKDVAAFLHQKDETLPPLVVARFIRELLLEEFFDPGTGQVAEV